MRSLFIGRWQPFHQGHKTLIDKVLKEGNQVVIAIRDTEISEESPYTTKERIEMINAVYGKNNDKVKIITIPDIKEVCYGRKVGWSIRHIRLDRKIERISASKIRNSEKRVIWLTGNTGSGKSSIAYMLKNRLKAIVLDGDEMRASISLGAGFSKKDRNEHNLRVARLAKVLNLQGHNVIVSVIAPFQSTRNKIDKICKAYWIYIKGGGWGKDTPYEIPKKPNIIIDPSQESVLQSLDKIIKEVGNVKKVNIKK